MPHYADGTEAKVGDLVQGKGYNLKDAQGQLREIAGRIVSVTPGATSCNCMVAVTEIKEERPMEGFKWPDWQLFQSIPANGLLIVQDCARSKVVILKTEIKYGQCDHFRKIPELRVVEEGRIGDVGPLVPVETVA